MTTPEHIRTHDNTMMSAATKCLRLYHTRHNRGLRANTAAPALNFGKIVHEGLRVWYETGDAGEAIMHVKDDPDFEETLEDYRTRGRALVTLAEYIEHYSSEENWWGTDGVILNETNFSVIDPTDMFRWGGRIDLVVRWNGGLWIVDHKTTSMGGHRWWDEYMLSAQMGGYVFAGGLLTSEKIDGVIVNRITVQKRKKPPEEQFERRPFLWPAWKLKEWKEQQIKNYNLIATAQADDHWPPDWNACIGRYGRCPFFDVCTLPPNSRERALEADFIHDPWDWKDNS